MAFTHYRTKGIILAKENKGEADQLLSVFTRDFGKLEILAKAIRKTTSKLRSSADLFYLSEIEFIQGKNYKILTDALALDKFKNVQASPEKFEITQKITWALDSLTGPEEKDDKIWRMLFETIKELNVLKSEIRNLKLEIIYYYFLWNLFSVLGYGPELYLCTICGKKLAPETFFFSPEEGGLVCWKCFKDLKEEEKGLVKEISVDSVKIIRMLLNNDWSVTKRIKAGDTKNLREVSNIYLEYLRENL